MNTIKVKGMSCQHCQAAVKSALEELGLTSVSVSLEEGTASYEGQAAPDALAAAIDDAGFELG